MNNEDKDLQSLVDKEYKYGFVSEIESVEFPSGLNEDIIRRISEVKGESQFMLDFRLQAYQKWIEREVPEWSTVHYPPIDYQNIVYYSAPKSESEAKSLNDIAPEILDTYKKLGIPLEEQAMLAGVVAVDAVLDSVSVATTYKEQLKELGVIFCPISEAIRDHADIVKKYIGSVVPISDNYYASLNSAVFSDGSFVYIPKGVKCPIELSSYFRINATKTGQFERTLIIAEEGSEVSYLEGCTAPQRDENQLHAAVVEIIVHKNAKVKYATVQNWYPGDKNGKGGIYNFVTKRGLCKGENSKLSWTQVETGSAITWKYPSVILRGDNSVGEFNSIAVTNNYQQADTGTKMIHIGKNTRSSILSKGIAAGKSSNTYRGLVRMTPLATGAKNYSRCDSLLIGSKCAAHTFPYIEASTPTARIEHEATTSKISDDQMFYCNQRGLDQDNAVTMIINGYCKEVLKQLPLEFAVEAQNLLALSLEGAIG